MKKVLILIFLLCGVLSGKAQIVEQGERNPMWGVRVAFDVNMPGKVHSNLIDDRMFRTGTGVTVGGVCNIALWNKLYLEPALSLYYDTYSYKNLTVVGDNYEESDPSIYKIGFRLPVVVGYSFSISDRLSIAPFTGPELSYAFAGATRLDAPDRYTPEDISAISPFNNQHRVDCGWKVGVAFFSGMWSFNIDGTIGMTDIMKGVLKCRESRGSVSVTRYF